MSVNPPIQLDDIRARGGAVVDCAADPCDLRPAKEHILARIDAASRNLRDAQAIVILVGEYHMRPVSKLLQTMVLDHLGQDPDLKIACGLEYSHDGLGMLMESSGFAVTQPAYAALAQNDKDGQRGLTTSLAALTLEDAPITNDTLLDFCRRHSISSRFNDAAVNRETLNLDAQDPLTRAVIEQYAPPEIPANDIPVESNVGMALRNIIMVQNIMAHIRDTGASIYVQQCGNDHVYGHRGDGCAYEHSLCAMFEQVGIVTIPVLTCDGDDVSTVPLAAKKAFANSVTLANLSLENFRAGEDGEVTFIQKVAAHSGTQFDVFEKNTPAHRGVLGALVNDAPSWLAELKR